MKEINVLITRNKKSGDTVEDVTSAPVVRAEELRASGNAMENLVRNVMAGKVGAPIRKAADNKKLIEVIPGDGMKNQRSALAFLLTLQPEEIRQAWAGYCENRERVTAPTLQRLHKLCRPEPAKREPKITVKQIVECWDSMPAEWREDTRATKFFDLMVSAAPDEG